MSKRTVAVEFKAEVRQSREHIRGFAREVRDVRNETRAAQEALGRFSNASRQAAAEAAGAWRDASGRLRDARGRFVAEGERLGDGFAQGFRRGAGRAGAGVFSSFANVGAGGRTMLLLAGGAAAAVAALQGIPPVLAAIGGGLGAIPGLAAGATTSLITVALGFNNIGKAVGEVFNPKAGGGGSAINQVAAAERRLAAAQREVRDAQVALNRAREEAARDLRDMRLELTGATLDEREAALDLAEAERELHDARAVGGAEDIERAEIAYKRAQLAVEQTHNRVEDLTVDQRRAADAGVEGSERVQAALRRQESATEGLISAQEALAAAAVSGGAAAVTAYSKLSPAAKAFVDEIARLRPELQGLQQLAQERIFVGLDKELADLARVGLPFARKQVGLFADDWNNLLRETGRAFAQPVFLRGVDAALAANDRVFDEFNARVEEGFATFGRLAGASAPFIDRFGGSLLSWADDFNAAVERAEATGGLDEFFADAAEQADALLDIGRELVVFLARVGAMDRGSTVLRTMADALERFNRNVRMTRDLRGIIETGNAALRGMVDVLLVAGEALGETLADPATRAAVELFFDVLKAVAEVVKDLTALFRLLPDPLQSVILAGLGLAVVWGKLRDIGGRVADTVDRVSGRLDNMGATGQRAGRGLQNIALWAGRAVTAFIALELAATVLDQFTADAPKVDRLAGSLKDLANSGQLSGEAARVLNRDFKQWRVDSGLVDSTLGKIGRTAESILPPMRSLNKLIFGGSFTGSVENYKAVDQALAQLVRSGNVQAAEQAFHRLAAGATLLPDEFRTKLRSVGGEYEAAMAELTRASDPVIRSQEQAAEKSRILAGSWEDAVREGRTLAGVMDTLSGATLAWVDAEIALEDAIDNASETIENNGKTLDVNTEAGRENLRALREIVDATRTAVKARFDETGSLEEANKAYEQGRQALIRSAMQAGQTREQAERLADQWLKMPPLVQTTVVTQGLGQAMSDIRALVKVLEGIPDSVDIRIGGPGRVVARRWGGITEHAQTGLLREAAMYSAQSPARYAFAEPATGGEAFIPRYGEEARSVSIGRRAMQWYGYDVVPKQTMAFAAYGGAMRAPAGPSADQIGAAVAAHLAPALTAAAVAGGGDVVVQVDSVAVARATRQGERNLTRRGR